jgi:hypothetical protein
MGQLLALIGKERGTALKAIQGVVSRERQRISVDKRIGQKEIVRCVTNSIPTGIVSWDWWHFLPLP